MNKSYFWFRLNFDRSLSKSLWKQFLILGAGLLVILALSYIMLSFSGAEWEQFCHKKDLNKWLLPVYLLIDSNVFSNLYLADNINDGAVHGWMLIASSIIFLLGAFVFNGIIISIITNSIGQRVSNHKAGRIHYLKSGHYIIMGWDEMVPSIILHIFEKDKDAYVLLMSAVESEKLREKLHKTFDEERLKRIIINYGHKTSADYYHDIHIESANKIYIVGLRTLSSHDAVNVECVDSICDYLEQPAITERPKRITCVFEDLDTYAAFKTSEIFKRVTNLGIEFVPYNFYAGWAKQVFIQQYHTDKNHPGKKIAYPTLFGKGYNSEDESALTAEDSRYVHLVFVGTTNFAVAFAMEAANVLHFPNGNKMKTRITFIDKNADEEKAEFIVRNRHFFEVQQYIYYDLTNGKNKEELGVRKESVYFNTENGYSEDDANFLDVEFEFIKGDVFSKAIQGLIADWAEEHNEHQYLSIFLAMTDQHQNFVMGMNMPDAVYDNEVPVFIRQDHSDNFVSNLRSADEKIRSDKKKNTHYKYTDGVIQKNVLGGRYANIYPFGMNDTGYSADDKSLERAKLINYLYSTMLPPDYNKFQSLLILNAIPKEQIWAEANEYWRDLTVALKWSNLYNAYSMRIKLAILRSMRGLAPDDTSQDFRSLSDEEVEVMAHIEHNRWNVEKLLMGYRKAHKDEDKYAVEDEYMKKELNKNKNRFIHHDIRPFDQLDTAQQLDREVSKYIPWIMKMTKSK